jgi:mannosyltransferase
VTGAARLSSWIRDQFRTTPRDWPDTISLSLLVAVTVLGASLRFYRLGAAPLWVDEGYTWMVTHFSLRDVSMTLFDTNPPVYWVVEWVFARFGESEALLRTSSALAGTATIPILYFGLRRRLGAAGALSAAATLATMVVGIKYSQNARPYALQLMFLTLTAFAFVDIFEGPSKAGTENSERRVRLDLMPVRALFLYALFALLSIYTHYSSVFFLAATNIAFLPKLSPKSSASLSILVGLMVTNAAIVVSSAPIVLLVHSGGGVLIDWLKQVSLLEAVSTVKRILVSTDYPSMVAPLVLVPFALGLLCAGFAKNATVVRMILTALVILPLVEWLVGFEKAVLMERTILFTAIGGACAIGACAAYLRGPVAASVLTAAILAQQSVSVSLYYKRPVDTQWKDSSSFLGSHVLNGDAILVCQVFFPYYYNRNENVFRIDPSGGKMLVHEMHWDTWLFYQSMPLPKRLAMTPEQVHQYFQRDHSEINSPSDLSKKYTSVWLLTKYCRDFHSNIDYDRAIALDLENSGYVADIQKDWGPRLIHYTLRRARHGSAPGPSG